MLITASGNQENMLSYQDIPHIADVMDRYFHCVGDTAVLLYMWSSDTNR